MKKILLVLLALALTGCAVTRPEHLTRPATTLEQTQQDWTDCERQLPREHPIRYALDAALSLPVPDMFPTSSGGFVVAPGQERSHGGLALGAIAECMQTKGYTRSE